MTAPTETPEVEPCNCDERHCSGVRATVAPTETPSPATCPGCGGPTTFAETIGTFCASKDCDRVDDMRPPPGLTTGQARDLAATWAVDNGGGSGFAIFDAGLTDEKTKQLKTWVRARVESLLNERPGMRESNTVRGWLLSDIAAALALSLADGEALIDAASGWPS